MFANKGRLKVALLIVGVFAVVSLEMYGAFHVQDAYGDGAAVHNNIIGSSNTVISNSKSKVTKTCPAGSHARNYITETEVTQKCKRYTHRHLNWKLQWVVQYTRIYDCRLVTTTSSYWEICNYRYSNGNQCGG